MYCNLIIPQIKPFTAPPHPQAGERPLPGDPGPLGGGPGVPEAPAHLLPDPALPEDHTSQDAGGGTQERVNSHYHHLHLLHHRSVQVST